MWAERRREHLSGGTHGRGSAHKVRLMGTREGRIERAEIEVLADVGAYPHNGTSIPAFSRLVAVGLYDIPEVSVTTTSVVTNAAPTGSYRGAGRPEAAFAIERAIDVFARKAGLDPVAVRFTNLIPSSALPHRTATGALYDSGDYPAALRRAVELVGLDEVRSAQSRRRRRGPRSDRDRVRCLRREGGWRRRRRGVRTCRGRFRGTHVVAHRVGVGGAGS